MNNSSRSRSTRRRWRHWSVRSGFLVLSAWIQAGLILTTFWLRVLGWFLWSSLLQVITLFLLWQYVQLSQIVFGTYLSSEGLEFFFPCQMPDAARGKKNESKEKKMKCAMIRIINKKDYCMYYYLQMANSCEKISEKKKWANFILKEKKTKKNPKNKNKENMRKVEVITCK